MCYEKKELTPEQLASDYAATTIDQVEVGDYIAYKTKERTWKKKDGEEIEYKSKINQGYVTMKPDPARQEKFKDTGYIWGFRGVHGGSWKQNERFIEKVWKATPKAVEAHKEKIAEKMEAARKRKKEIAEEDSAQYDIAKEAARKLEKDPKKVQEIANEIKKARIKRVRNPPKE